MLKRTAGWMLALCMVLAVFFPAAAVGKDTSGHWAQQDMEYLSQKGIMNGYPDGTFRPNAKITKAEYITLINRTFDLTASGYKNYPDVASNAWYANEIARADEAGYLFTFSGKVRPDEDLTREEAAAMFGRLLGLSGGLGTSFSDTAKLSDWSRQYIDAVAQAGIISGYPDNTFRPKDTITRAEVARVVNNVIGNYYDAAGTYSTSVTKNVTAAASGVTLQNITIPGNLYITQGAANGTVTLSGVSVGGGVYAVGSPNTTLVLAGQSGSVTVDPSGLKLQVTGTVDTLTLTSAYAQVNLEVAAGAKIKHLISNVGGSVTGSGEIEKVTVNAGGLTSSITPKEWVIKAGVTAVFGGKTVTASGKAGPAFAANYPAATLKEAASYGMGSIELRAKSDTPQAGRAYFIAVSRGSTAPTAEQIKAAQNYGYVQILRSASAELPQTGAEVSATLSGLSTATLYDVWAVIEVSASQQTGYAQLLGEPVKVEPKQSIFSADYPQVRSSANGSATIDVRTTRATTVYWAVLPRTAAAPTADQLVNTTGTLSGVVQRGSKAVQPYGTDSFAVSGLTNAMSSYMLYLVTRDAAGTVDPAAPMALDLSAAENSVKAVFAYQPTNNEYPTYTSVTLEFTKEMFNRSKRTPMSFLTNDELKRDHIKITERLAATGAERVLNNNTDPAKEQYSNYTIISSNNRQITIMPPSGGWMVGAQYTIEITGLADEAFRTPSPEKLTFSTSGGADIVSAPVIIPDGGSVVPGTQITISTSTQGAGLQYRVNDGYPFYSTASQVTYTVPAGVKDFTITASASYNGRNSVSVEREFTVGTTSSLPMASIPSGTSLPAGTMITLSVADKGSTIYYTTDGSVPSRSSPYFQSANADSTPSGAVYVSGTQSAKFVIRALSYKGGASSAVQTFEYYVNTSGQSQIPKPTVYINTSGWNSAVVADNSTQSVTGNSTITVYTMSSGQQQGVYYTQDGTDPRSSSTRRWLAAGQPVSMSSLQSGWSNMTLRLVAVGDFNNGLGYAQYSDVFTVALQFYN